MDTTAVQYNTRTRQDNKIQDKRGEEKTREKKGREEKTRDTRQDKTRRTGQTQSQDKTILLVFSIVVSSGTLGQFIFVSVTCYPMPYCPGDHPFPCPFVALGLTMKTSYVAALVAAAVVGISVRLEKTKRGKTRNKETKCDMKYKDR